MPSAQEVLKAARADLGYRERADGTTKHGAWYVHNKPAPDVFASAPWCQMACGYWANEAGLPEDAFPRLAYTPYAVQWFKDRGRWGSTPKVGALVYYNFPGGDAVDHVEIVEAVRADGSIVTIGGNVSNAVQRVVRRYNIAGYGYPNYADSSAKTWMETVMDELPLLEMGAEKKAANRPHIKTAYKLLDARGYPLAVGVDDQTFGAPMDKRVRELQKAKRLTVDGQIGPKTWAKLVLP